MRKNVPADRTKPVRRVIPEAIIKRIGKPNAEAYCFAYALKYIFSVINTKPHTVYDSKISLKTLWKKSILTKS